MLKQQKKQLAFLTGFVVCLLCAAIESAAEDSSSCLECHPTYCEAWNTTSHGRSLQPYTPEIASQLLGPQDGDIAIGTLRYSFKSNDQAGWIEEKTESSTTNYQISWLVGGKTIIALLTTMGRGRQQILPLAYDVKKKIWFDNTAMLPHGRPPGSGSWKSYTGVFSTDCFSCHVDSAKAFYTVASDSYAPLPLHKGISCSSCHGSTEIHVQTARTAQNTESPAEYNIFSLKNASPEYINDTCASCHANRIALTAAYSPGEPFFDHFDLNCLESSAFFPDGSPRGDSHIYTQWRMSPCAQSGQLHCLHCHTNGGGYRFSDPAQANKACLPCHKDRVNNVRKHTHHRPKSSGSRCIACHMPASEIKGFKRTNHSLRPPLPWASTEFYSPNACTYCHTNKTPSWAEKKVASWHIRAYQEPYLTAGILLQAAKKEDWSRLQEMLSYIESPGRDEITAASLIRLIRKCPDRKKWPVCINSVKSDPSPLVRSAAAGSLKGSPMDDTATVLFAALNDTYALVRIRAVSMLAMLSIPELRPKYRPGFQKALHELTNMLSARPDDPEAYFNLGNLMLERQAPQRALAMYDQSLKLRPDNFKTLVNSAMALYASGKMPAAERKLRSALKLHPHNSPTLVILGMLLNAQKRPAEAEAAFRKAIKHDPTNAAAYYNLSVINAEVKPKNSLIWCKKAHGLDPGNPKYAYTYAFYLNRAGKTDTAIAVLKNMVQNNTPHPETYALLADIYLSRNKKKSARSVYLKALNNTALPKQKRRGFMIELQKLE